MALLGACGKGDTPGEDGFKYEAVFIGDSITANWVREDRGHPDFFQDHNFLAMGYSGKTTAYLKQLFKLSVIDKHPCQVVISADGVPYWDFDDPEIPNTYRDASAAAVMCSAFLELSGLSKDRKLSGQCLDMARQQIRTLASPSYLASPGENGGFLLKHSVGNLPSGSEIDTPLIYADYYFLEALNRYKH